MDEKKPKSAFNIVKRAWNFIWKGEGWLSWIAFIAAVFIFIKFIFFPAISFITGTSLPIVIVESCSMYHGESFDDWWSVMGNWYGDKGINKTAFSKFPLKNGFAKGDIFFVTGVKIENLQVGDTIIFRSGVLGRPIIHRVVSINPLETKGDHNAMQFIEGNNAEKIDETKIDQSQIVGKVAPLKIPVLGWLKLIFFEPFRTPNERGLCRI